MPHSGSSRPIFFFLETLSMLFRSPKSLFTECLVTPINLYTYILSSTFLFSHNCVCLPVSEISLSPTSELFADSEKAMDSEMAVFFLSISIGSGCSYRASKSEGNVPMEIEGWKQSPNFQLYVDSSPSITSDKPPILTCRCLS